MKLIGQIATVMVASIIPLVILATAGVLCMSKSEGTQIIGIWIFLGAGLVTGIYLGVRVMDRLDI